MSKYFDFNDSKLSIFEYIEAGITGGEFIVKLYI